MSDGRADTRRSLSVLPFNSEPRFLPPLDRKKIAACRLVVSWQAVRLLTRRVVRGDALEQFAGTARRAHVVPLASNGATSENSSQAPAVRKLLLAVAAHEGWRL